MTDDSASRAGGAGGSGARTGGRFTRLEELGWSDAFAVNLPDDPARRAARVASVYSARVDVWTLEGPRLASLRSRALSARAVEGGIAVGDWVVVAPAGGGSEDEIVVEDILPRRTIFLRQAAGERAEPQAIAANVDRVFVVTAADADFNIRRLERYLVAIAAGGAEAQIVLTKTDLVADADRSAMLETATALASSPVLATSAKTGEGIEELLGRIPPGMTAAVVGSSGVGKSALLNCVLGREAQREGAVRAYDGKGRHTTTRRQLFVLPNGGLLIDTPGMRELKPWLPHGSGIDDAFDDISTLAETCHYRDCLHANEPGCAVRGALERGELTADRFQAWQKLALERAELGPRQTAAAGVAAKRRDRSAAVALRKRIRDKSE